MIQLDILKAELITDPLTLGYSGLSDQAVADSLNAVNRNIELSAVSGSELFNALDPAEFSSLTNTQEQFVRDVFSLGEAINVSTGTNTRKVLLNAFGTGTTTRGNIAALVQTVISRASELGLPRVSVGYVARARA